MLTTGKDPHDRHRRHRPRHLTGWHAVMIDEETDPRDRKTYRQWIVRDARNNEVCRVFYVTADGEAQARLIAAAPALLAAARAILNSSDYDEDDRPLMRNLRAAVAQTEAR